MTDYDPPTDLVELRATWLAAEAAHKRVCDEANAGPEITTPAPPPVYAVSPVEKWVQKQHYPTADQLERREKAYALLVELTLKLADHPENKGAVEIAARRAAQELYDAEHATPVG